ncbi:cell division protein Fic [Dyadobacter beijingensis]|uniref:Cell division protein Fic n=1 Tax=Dyadobacter beijingensis TaxID=365489 RepID=A0ABQ2I5R6_9BACT|nr:Fic family protein [Dyadobacter beijingensis]GGM98474.1 cell division protein Fic [Dyadobacter beijingensis]
MPRYIHQRPQWPNFYWDETIVSPVLGQVRYMQGKISGRMEALGFSVQTEAILQTLTEDVLKSSEIEGEILNIDQVRSSVARRLGLELAGLIPSDRNVDGVVEMILDATQRYGTPLTADRLFGWHSSLFPSGRSGMFKITVGNWRDHEKGPMQVVSGAMGKEIVHFEAPDASRLEAEMALFTQWFNDDQGLDAVLKSGIAHLWFVTIHPFDDGNGRIARAIADMQLARADDSTQRYYSMSSQIRRQRNEYYAILEKTQKGDLDITAWLEWFLLCLQASMKITATTLDAVLKRVHFWDKHASTALNARQRTMINKMQEGFFGQLSSSKWAKMVKSSQDTATRDIQDLVEKGVLKKSESGGRSTHYELLW